MTEPPYQWLPLPEAAEKLGIAENALRSRIKRRTVRSRKDNQGRLQVYVSGTEDRTRTLVRPKSGPGSNHTVPHREPRAPLPAPSDSVPLTVHREIIAALQAAHEHELVRLAQAHRSAVDALMQRVGRMLVAQRPAPRAPWWSRLFGNSKIGGS